MALPPALESLARPGLEEAAKLFVNTVGTQLLSQVHVTSDHVDALACQLGLGPNASLYDVTKKLVVDGPAIHKAIQHAINEPDSILPGGPCCHPLIRCIYGKLPSDMKRDLIAWGQEYQDVLSGFVSAAPDPNSLSRGAGMHGVLTNIRSHMAARPSLQLDRLTLQNYYETISTFQKDWDAWAAATSRVCRSAETVQALHTQCIDSVVLEFDRFADQVCKLEKLLKASNARLDATFLSPYCCVRCCVPLPEAYHNIKATIDRIVKGTPVDFRKLEQGARAAGGGL